MDTAYVKSLLDPLVKEAADRWETNSELSKALRQRVAAELIELGFSVAVAVQAAGKTPYHGVIATHLWEMDHIVPVVHGGGGCGLSNLRTLCRVCHGKATKALAAVRAKDRHVQKKQARHEERMAMKARGDQLPLSRKWRHR